MGLTAGEVAQLDLTPPEKYDGGVKSPIDGDILCVYWKSFQFGKWVCIVDVSDETFESWVMDKEWRLGLEEILVVSAIELGCVFLVVMGNQGPLLFREVP